MPTMTDDEAALWARYHETRNEEARNALVERYLPFVHKSAIALASKLPDCVTAEDVLADGVVGLIEAIEKYDPARGWKFTTFATTRVRGAMLDELRKNDWVPRLVRRQEKELEAHRTRLRQELSREPTASDLGARGAAHIKSLDEPMYACDRGVRTRGDVTSSREPAPEHGAERRDFWSRACRGLSRVERIVVILYFREAESMKSIGRQIGLSESRVSQMMKDLKPRMRRNLSDA